MYKNKLRHALGDYRYFNSKRGFIVNKISVIFTPRNQTLRKGRNTSWKVECTKEEVYQKLMNHIIIMKEKYPETDGYLCNYCKKPFTYKKNMGTRNSDQKKTRSKFDPTKAQNFSIDRWDPKITYTYDNIRFCCLSCNDRKGSSNPDDWNNFKEAQYEDR